MLERLHKILRKAGVSDTEIANGFDLTQAGKEKIAAGFGITPKEVTLLLASLTTKVREDRDREELMVRELAEGGEDDRFGFEKDVVGNVTVRDTKTGREKFLRGTDAATFLDRVGTASNPQALMAGFLAEAGKTPFLPMDAHDEEHFAALRDTGFYGKQGAGCLIMARDTGRFLMPLRSRHVEQPGTWGTWGGAIDGRESPMDAVKREVREEAGFTGPVEVRPLFVFKKGTFAYHNFLVIVDSEFRPKTNWETAAAKWCEWGHFPKPLHFGLVAVLNDPESVQTIEHELHRASETVQEVIESALMENADDAYEHMFKVMNFHETAFQSVWSSLKRKGEYTQSLGKSYAKWTPGEWAQVNNQIAPDYKVTVDPEAHTFTIHVMTTFESLEEADEDFEETINASNGGTYNFPWKVGGQNGFGTARFTGQGRAMQVKVVSVRDQNGDPVDLSPQDMQAVSDQAVDFIGQE